MTRGEFEEMIRFNVSRGIISLSSAAMMRHFFDVSEQVQAAFPVSLSSLPGRLTETELKEAASRVAVHLTARTRKKWADSPRPTKETPPDVKKFLRERLRNRLRGDYENRMARMATSLHSTRDVAGWHAQMIKEQRSYIARMMTAGVGRPLAKEEIDIASRLAVQQQNFLQRFAGEISVRFLDGRPFSLRYLINRSQMYGGMGWEAWHRGNEKAEARGDGYVINYIAKDDNKTCSPCHEAERNGPYLPGAANVPYPGSVCRGHGLCRCRHEIVFDMDAWRKLKGEPEEPPKPAKKPRKPRTPKPAVTPPVAPVAPSEPPQPPAQPAAPGLTPSRPGWKARQGRDGRVELPYEPAAGWRESARNSVEKRLEPVAQSKGMTVKEWTDKLVDDVRGYVVGKNPSIRADAGSAEAIFRTGRFKTQFETNKSGGAFDKQSRTMAEASGLGAPPFLDDSQRPIYGYFTTPNHKAGSYGSVEFVLKTDILTRTTVTLGDSLYAMYDHDVVGLPANDLGPEMIADPFGVETAAYIEAQFHGQVTMDDVNHVVLHMTPYNRNEIQRLEEMFEDAGIAVILEDDDDN